jgi:cytochrome c-type biogenesis protein CcsB
MTVRPAMAQLSDTLFTTAIATYALAMVGYTAEYAFGRRGRTAVATVRADTPALEFAGHGRATHPAPSPPRSLPRETSSAPGTAADRIGRASVAITVLGALIHAASVAVRASAVDAVPWSNMYEFASVAWLVGVAAFLAVLWKAPQIRHLGGFVLLPVVLLMFLAGTVLYSQAQPLVPALQSYWLAIHVSSIAVAEGILMTSAAITAMYLIRARYDRISAGVGADQQRRFATLGARLPAAASLDKAAYRTVAFAFPIYTAGVIFGAIWAEAAWGRYWGWDPKETWAFIAWVVYAMYLHARATAGWKGSRAGYINLLGFAAMTFNFFVVNIVISGLHSYAGLS